LSPAFARKLQRALQRLAQLAEHGEDALQRRLARETLQRIEAGNVLLGDVGHPLPQDLYHMCRDRRLDACRHALAHPEGFSVSEDERRAIVAPYEGYMWGNRVYIKTSRTLTDSDLAATLVHETNHVLNRSECHYYSDLEEQIEDDTLGYLEEYRAFVAECLYYDGRFATAERCDAYAVGQIAGRGYTFATSAAQIAAPQAASTLALDLLRDGSAAGEGRYGHMLPLKTRFAASFDACD
jgi:hypothetical protein